MNWIRTHYDRVILMAAVIFLFVCAISIWRSAARFGTNLTAQQTAAAPKLPRPSAKTIELERATKKLEQPPQWTFNGRSGLFVPEKHFIGSDGLPATLKTTQLHPPVPNEWLEEFGLLIADADVLSQDADTDGFTNLDEWEGHTNPTEKNSHPDYLTKLKLRSFSEEPFPLIFSSWMGDSYAINTIDLKEPTQFRKLGEAITGTRFKIVSFREKYERNQYGTDVDVSELMLQHEDTGERITLVKEKVAISPESVATFIYPWPAGSPPNELLVRKDQEFSLKPLEHISYKLVDVQPTKAVIVNTRKPDERIEIGPLAPSIDENF